MTRWQSTVLACLSTLSVVAACGDSGAQRAGDRPVARTPADLPEVLATVDGDEITFDDLPEGTSQQLAQLDNSYRQQRHDLLAGALDQAVADAMLAKEASARDMTVAEVVQAETGGPPPAPTDSEVEAWYRQNQSRLQGRSLEELREQIREFLRNNRAQASADSLDARLREKYDVRLHLDPFRVDVDDPGAPALGAADAPVTLVEFSDFECPFCGRFFPTLKRIEEDYGDRIRIVYRQFPIPTLHSHAFKAAEASLCADDQGEFWAYHDLLFQEQDRLSVRDLKEKAGRLGLDRGAFDECLDTGRKVEQVQDDQAAGQAAGVAGTPALFVNGVPIPGGAVSYDVLAEALDAELARTGG
ncbi:MAG: thioredoxin domain-containing protein [Gemmatimonadales bacterium]|jgi:predicted DsbA family dithiol-disulfide isomerase